MMRAWRTSLVILLGLPLSACGAAEEALQKNLQGIVSKVEIADGKITATCVNQVVVTVDEEKIEPDSPGGASKEGIARVMQEIQAGCEAPAVAAQKEEREQERFKDECKKQRIKCEGTAEEMQVKLCEKLSSDLPLRGERRDRAITSNAKNWGCGDPGPPKLGPNGYWEIDKSGRGRRRIVTAKLDSDPDEEGRFGRLSVRCQGRKGEMYLAETFGLKKSRKIVGTADGKKLSWTVAMSTDRKAVFMKDPKDALGDLRGKKELILNLVNNKRQEVARKFPIGGIENAVKKLGRRCRL